LIIRLVAKPIKRHIYINVCVKFYHVIYTAKGKANWFNVGAYVRVKNGRCRVVGELWKFNACLLSSKAKETRKEVNWKIIVLSLYDLKKVKALYLNYMTFNTDIERGTKICPCISNQCLYTVDSAKLRAKENRSFEYIISFVKLLPKDTYYHCCRYKDFLIYSSSN
jgi:hypothetical protein